MQKPKHGWHVRSLQVRRSGTGTARAQTESTAHHGPSSNTRKSVYLGRSPWRMNAAGLTLLGTLIRVVGRGQGLCCYGERRTDMKTEIAEEVTTCTELHRDAQTPKDGRSSGGEEQGDRFLCALIGRDVARYKRGCRKKHGSSRRSVHLGCSRSRGCEKQTVRRVAEPGGDRLQTIEFALHAKEDRQLPDAGSRRHEPIRHRDASRSRPDASVAAALSFPTHPSSNDAPSTLCAMVVEVAICSLLAGR